MTAGQYPFVCNVESINTSARRWLTLIHARYASTVNGASRVEVTAGHITSPRTWYRPRATKLGQAQWEKIRNCLKQQPLRYDRADAAIIDRWWLMARFKDVRVIINITPRVRD